MEQRALRLGDNVDDYCPRERRITNHAIVALVGDAIRQTRCTTCDTEHVYKEGREPRRRKKDSPAALYEQVLADAGGQLVQPHANGAPESADAPDPDSSGLAAADDVPPSESQLESGGDAEGSDAEDRDRDADVWPGHRQLIRATLPRTEGEPPPPRPIPEFTIYQRPQGRGAHGAHGARQATNGWNGFGNGRPRGSFEANGNRDTPGNGRDGQSPGRPPGRHGRHRGKHKRPR